MLRYFLVKILLNLKILIDIVINILNENRYLSECNEFDKDKESIVNECVINSICKVLNSNDNEESNWKNTILGLDNEDENFNKYEEKYIEEIIDGMIEVEKISEEKLLYNDIYRKKDNKTDKAKKNIFKTKANFQRVDIKSICEDLTISAIEKIYLINLIANINVGNSCIEISVDQLTVLFNNNNRNQVIKKMKDLEAAGIIKKISGVKKNKYFIFKHIKENVELVKNDTSIISDTVKSKEIVNKKDKNLLVNIISKNIKYLREGIDLNENYINQIILDDNKL